MGLLVEVRLLVRRTVSNNLLGAVGEREGPGQNLDHWTAAHDLHHLGSTATVDLLPNSLAVHLAVVLFSVLFLIRVAVGIHLSFFVLLSLLFGRVVLSGCPRCVGDRQVIRHPQHLVRALADGTVRVVGASAQIQRQCRAGAGHDPRCTLLDAASLDLECVWDLAGVGHFEHD